MQRHAGVLGLIAASLIVTDVAASVDRSLIPQPRPAQQSRQVPTPVLAQQAPINAGIAPTRSLFPAARPDHLGQPRSASLERWLRGFRSRALAQGIQTRVFDRAFAGVQLDPDILQRESRQPEFSRPIWAYLDSAVSESRIRNGRAMLREHRRVLDEIEDRYGVDREVVVAIWGMESAYGSLRGSTRIIPALTTLAISSRRSNFYEQQLIGALQILQAGDVDERHLVGSWAGAMGHTQFIPTSYLAYAVDFRGDGHRDIWSDDPTDSLASTAAYLSRHGWTRGQPWGVEVRVPSGFNPRLANTRRGVQEWVALGIRGQRGVALPTSGEATLMFPAGSQGPAILAFQNFRVIKRYNNADAYAIGVGHLADRLRGEDGFVADWPRDDRPLSRSEREELQRLLQRAGHYSGAIDGRVGSGTLSAVRDWQAANGLPPDGYVSLALLERMRR
ncbi:MAG: lytic murein transglycosylase [Rhodobacteraceae bacterium]|jgi:membrane-bound lytic murein transglycosylase B|nr:lytic murein transglycosylase [Paracoccaceae bacterium]